MVLDAQRLCVGGADGVAVGASLGVVVGASEGVIGVLVGVGDASLGVIGQQN